MLLYNRGETMEKQSNKRIMIFSVVFYLLAVAMMVLGSINDLQIDIALFNPENTVSQLAEQFSQFVYWGIWGPAFTLLFLCRHSLNESLEIIGKLLPFVKPVKEIGRAHV